MFENLVSRIFLAKNLFAVLKIIRKDGIQKSTKKDPGKQIFASGPKMVDHPWSTTFSRPFDRWSQNVQR